MTSDYVVLELERREIPYFRLNAEWIPQYKIRFSPMKGIGSFEIDCGARTISVNAIGAAYYRRPGTPIAHQAVQSVADCQYCQDEWLSALKAIYSMLEGKWLNAPHLIEAAENKPLQLAIALQLGFRIPDTRITNDINFVRDLRETGSLIAKPLRSALVGTESDPRVIFTNSIEEREELNEHAVSVAPIIFQHQIEKAVDVRVTVVGSRIFAAAIHSQMEEETRVDWRKGSNVLLEHSVLDIPLEIQEKCIALVGRLNLKFGAIDLILDKNGEFWFLEINPNGQWAWIEYRTGLPITSGIVDELVSIMKR